MYDDLLEQIASEMKEFDMALQLACAPADLERLRSKAVQELGHALPDAYAAFLARANGLDWNGLVVYASERTAIVGFTDRFIEGYVEGNLDYRDLEALKDYLVFADDGVALFTYHINSSEYRVVTTIGLTLLESFRTFDELLTIALQRHL